MKIEIRLFAAAAELAQSSSVFIELPEQSQPSIGNVARELISRYPQLTELTRRSRWAAENEFVELDFIVDPKMALALIPPVSGG